ncbi:TPA: reverse transcriptase domain-containing protein [Raoultella planticola]
MSLYGDLITIDDLYLAYRKSKQEAFLDTFYENSIKYAEFEEQLHTNIERLYDNLTSVDSSWYLDVDFIGGYLYIPKKINDDEWNKKIAVHYRSVDPNTDWLQRYKENKNKKLSPEYRLIITPSVEYQIVSALWIIKVGHRFEGCLNDEYSYGNRLKRYGSKKNNHSCALNNNTSGLFVPYFNKYRTWKNKGLDVMREMLSQGKDVTAVTMDITSFYHRVCAKFVLRPAFLRAINVTLNVDEKKFTKMFIESIDTWYSNTPDVKKRPEGSLPVGLSASKIISNILLYELDLQISEGLATTYYGRYVDDLFFVFETPNGLLSGDAIINYISQNVECIKIERKKNIAPNLKIRLQYAEDSNLEFKAEKQRIFSLSSEHGMDLINKISSQIREQASEYRMLPSVPKNSIEMAEKTLLASSDASLVTDALRKADALSLRRLGISLLIRDIEKYSQNLNKNDWIDIRKEFYDLAGRYLLTPKGFFEYSNYYSKIFLIMIINHDFSAAKIFIYKLNETLLLIRETTLKSTKAEQDLCSEYFAKILIETAIKASTVKNFNGWNELDDVISDLERIFIQHNRQAKSNHQELSKKLLVSDLGFRPYKDYWYYEQKYDADCISIPDSKSIIRTLRLPAMEDFRNRVSLKKPYWPALAFSTRALSIKDMVLIYPDILQDFKFFKDSIMGFRGAKIIRQHKFINPTSENVKYAIPYYKRDKVNVALTSFETSLETYTMVLQSKPDRSLIRYEKLNVLINKVLQSKEKIDYIVFPECSIPRKWAIDIANKLASQGISFLTGLEYYKKNGDEKLRNDSLISLTTCWPGYPINLMLTQSKMNPSYDEVKELKKYSKELFIPSSDIPPAIYSHGDFFFGLLICSDLTNPRNRVHLQGKVDTLFVLEWNADVNTFSYLVEGAAHDIHAFIVQVNNRIYGDSRLRTPYRKSFKRDLVRLKGGIDDYYVIAEIDYLPLRDYQLNGDMTDQDAEFKPIPIGFKYSDLRAVYNTDKIENDHE